jgi:hypothetical protein
MCFPESQRLRSLLGPALLALLLFGAGCVSPNKRLFTATGPGWRVQQGQALWRPGAKYPELGGDLLVASHEDGRCFLEFAKTPMVLVSVQTTPTQWLIQFPPRRIGFRGHGHPSTRFAWLHLPAALAGQSLPPAFRFERQPDGAFRLENLHTGETMAGFLSP